MQNNVIELTQRLLRALDSNYNVIDMPTVISVVSLLEQVAVTKELLEATRLGRHVNELRRKTNNDQLSKRAKLLVKKWRSIVLPTEPPPSSGGGAAVNNGQLKQATAAASSVQSSDSSVGDGVTAAAAATPTHQQRKRSAKSSPETSSGTASAPPSKRLKANGQQQKSPPPPLPPPPQQQQQSSSSELFELSDNSNSSFKDVINTKLGAATGAAAGGGNQASAKQQQQQVIMINSDSNESNPSSVQPVQQQLQQQPQVEEQQPKKRGRKKGSKNHKNLLDEAESLFTNKLAVSRGNSKVKTTQELIAGLQNRNNQAAAAAALGSTTPNSSNSSSMTPGKSNSKGEDLNLRAAKLTERVSIIDKKLNTNANRYKNAQQRARKLAGSEKSTRRVIESGSVINDKNLFNNRRQAHHRFNRLFEDDSDEVIVVDDVSSPHPSQEDDDENSLGGTTDGGRDSASGTHQETDDKTRTPEVRSLSYDEAIALLPPINRDWLLEEEDLKAQEPVCTCVVKENKDFSVEDNDDELLQRFELIEDDQCPAGGHFAALHAASKVSPEQLHRCPIEGVNGNRGLGPPPPPPVIDPTTGLYANVVPNVNNELVPKDVVDTVVNNNKKSCLAEQKEPSPSAAAACPCCVKCTINSRSSGSRSSSPTFAGENYKKYSISEEQRTECDRCGCHQDVAKKTGVVVVGGDVESGILNSEQIKKEEELDETSSSLPPPPEQEKSDNSCKNGGGDGATKTAVVKSPTPLFESFREWHEVLARPSFNDETLRILPYVIID